MFSNTLKVVALLALVSSAFAIPPQMEYGTESVSEFEKDQQQQQQVFGREEGGMTFSSSSFTPSLKDIGSGRLIRKLTGGVPPRNILNRCVDTAIHRLGINMDMETDFNLVKDIVENDMHLGDSPQVQQLLQSRTGQRHSLRPLLNKVRQGITQVHPILGVTLCKALKDPSTQVIFTNVNSQQIKRTIHHMYILDKIVEKISTDKEFLTQVQRYFEHKMHDKSFATRVRQLFKSVGLFGVAKAYTVEDIVKDDVKYLQHGNISPAEVERRKQRITLNLLETSIVDLARGNTPNAQVGSILAFKQPRAITVEGGKKVQYDVDMNWARVYQAWHLAFITGNFENLSLFYASSLIPQVITASPKDFINKKILSLYMTVNFYVLGEQRGQGQQRVSFEGKHSLANLAGKVNLKYVKALAVKKLLHPEQQQ